MSEKIKYRAVIQARMMSNRLRGKSLMPVSGVPLLQWVLDRTGQMSFLDDVVVATSDTAADLPIALFAKNYGVQVVRGDSLDVLERFVRAAEDLDENDVLVRFTADNPLYDVKRAQQAYEAHHQARPDYSHIDGLSHLVPEFARVGCLRKVAASSPDPFHCEHVTIFIRQHSDQFEINTLPSDFAGLRPEYEGEFTIDRQDQLKAFETMVSELASSPNPINIKLDDCYRWLDEKAKSVSTEQPPHSETIH